MCGSADKSPTWMGKNNNNELFLATFSKCMDSLFPPATLPTIITTKFHHLLQWDPGRPEFCNKYIMNEGMIIRVDLIASSSRLKAPYGHKWLLYIIETPTTQHKAWYMVVKHLAQNVH